MKHSNQLDYLATIKKNHKIIVQFDEQEGDKSIDRIWRHLIAMKHATRLSGFSLIQSYSTAIHCFYTGILFEEIAKYEGIPISPLETKFVYRHDVLETVTGDVLLPVKIHSETTKKKWEEIEAEMVESKYEYLQNYTDEFAEKYFSSLSYKLFKACDLFELYLFCWEETELGNMTPGIWSIIYNCRKLLPEFKIKYITDCVNPIIK